MKRTTRTDATTSTRITNTNTTRSIITYNVGCTRMYTCQTYLLGLPQLWWWDHLQYQLEPRGLGLQGLRLYLDRNSTITISICQKYCLLASYVQLASCQVNIKLISTWRPSQNTGGIANLTMKCSLSLLYSKWPEVGSEWHDCMLMGDCQTTAWSGGINFGCQMWSGGTNIGC